jgi:hypothetical protein
MFFARCTEVALRIYSLITPLLLLNPSLAALQGLQNLPFSSKKGLSFRGVEAELAQRLQKRIILDLEGIVQRAGMAAFIIRRASFPIILQPPYKNTIFDAEYMESREPDFVAAGNPQSDYAQLTKGFRWCEAHWNDEPIVQVVCSSAVVLYAKGGPEDMDVRGDLGFRIKVLKKGIVDLRWGRERSVLPSPSRGAAYCELKDAILAAHRQVQGADLRKSIDARSREDYRRMAETQLLAEAGAPEDDGVGEGSRWCSVM